MCKLVMADDDGSELLRDSWIRKEVTQDMSRRVLALLIGLARYSRSRPKWKARERDFGEKVAKVRPNMTIIM